MTAAHKTLPIPTICRVTNIETGQSTKVLVDDRGPFVYDGRIIDLSIAAAKAIGVYKKGTANVRVTALTEESDRFSKHLAQYRRAKCPKGRRWVKIFQEDLTNDSSDLKSQHHANVVSLQQAVYCKVLQKKENGFGAWSHLCGRISNKTGRKIAKTLCNTRSKSARFKSTFSTPSRIIFFRPCRIFKQS